MNESIKKFLSSPAYAVVGASSNRQKFGNKVLRCYIQNKLKAYPINPNEQEVEGLKTVSTISDLPPEVQSISIITPPTVTEKIVKDAITQGIKNIWMQPGAESTKAIEDCKQHGINVIAGGPCILIDLKFVDSI
jgi:predicted CoA-binding protein